MQMNSVSMGTRLDRSTHVCYWDTSKRFCFLHTKVPFPIFTSATVIIVSVLRSFLDPILNLLFRSHPSIKFTSEISEDHISTTAICQHPNTCPLINMPHSDMILIIPKSVGIVSLFLFLRRMRICFEDAIFDYESSKMAEKG